jgi:hypothetical protein
MEQIIKELQFKNWLYSNKWGILTLETQDLVFQESSKMIWAWTLRENSLEREVPSRLHYKNKGLQVLFSMEKKLVSESLVKESVIHLARNKWWTKDLTDQLLYNIINKTRI